MFAFDCGDVLAFDAPDVAERGDNDESEDEAVDPFSSSLQTNISSQ